MPSPNPSTHTLFLTNTNRRSLQKLRLFFRNPGFRLLHQTGYQEGDRHGQNTVQLRESGEDQGFGTHVMTVTYGSDTVGAKLALTIRREKFTRPTKIPKPKIAAACSIVTESVR